MGNVNESNDLPLLLFLAPYFPPAYYGGVVQIYLGLLKRLKQFRIVVITDQFGSTAAEQQSWDSASAHDFGFTVRRIASFDLHFRNSNKRAHLSPIARISDRVTQMWEFYRDGKREWKRLLTLYKPDLVVCGGTYSAGWLTFGLSRDVPLVNYIHGEELTMQVSPRLLMPQMRRWQMRSIRRAELNIAVSDYSARLTKVLARSEPTKVVTLRNFVDTTRFCVSGQRTELRRKMAWENRLVLLTLARLEPRKGIDQALRALALLNQRAQLPLGWIYVIAGRGPERRALEELSHQLGVERHVEFRGFVTDDDVPTLYEAADIFLQPNREIHGDTEGFGVVFLEASACGLPVVGGIAGGTGDAIQEGVSGYRVDGDSVEAIASVLHSLCEDAALRTRLGAQGAERVAAEFTVEAAVKRFDEMLTGVLADHRTRQRMHPPI